MKKIYSLFVSFLFISQCIYAQSHIAALDTLKDRTFDEIVTILDHHYKTTGEKAKHYERWKMIHKHYVNEEGKIVNAAAYNIKKLKELNKINSINKSNTNDNWTPAGGISFTNEDGGLGRINCIKADPSNPNIMYVGTPNGGLWKTINGGGDWYTDGSEPSNWTPLTDQEASLGIVDIAIDYSSPVSNRTIYILTGDGKKQSSHSVGVLKSTDGGNTWQSTGLSFDYNQNIKTYCMIMHKNNPNILLVASDQGIHYTVNGFQSSTLVYNAPKDDPVYDLEYHPNNTGIIYAAKKHEIIKSSYNIFQWTTSVINNPPDYSRVKSIELAVTPNAQSNVYAIFGGVVNDSIFSGLYVSHNQGNDFDLRTNFSKELKLHFASSNLEMAINPIDSNQIHIGSLNVYSSNDGGYNWFKSAKHFVHENDSLQYTHEDINDLEFINGNLFCASDGGIYKTNNSGEDTLYWSNKSYGLQISQIYEIGTNLNPVSGGVSYGTHDNGINIAHFQNGAWNAWENIINGDGTTTIYDPINPNILYYSITGNMLLFKHDLQMDSYTFINPLPGPGTSVFSFRKPLTLNKKNGQLLAGYKDLFKSLDQGETWINLTEHDTNQFGAIHKIANAPSDPDIIYISRNYRIFKTSDGGDNWIEITFGITNIVDIIIHPLNPEIVWFLVESTHGSSTQRIYYSEDGGQTVSDITNGLDIPIYCLEYQLGSPNRIYIGTEFGVYYTDDYTPNWIPYDSNLPRSRVYDLEINYCTETIYAGTFGRGLWESPLQGGNYSQSYLNPPPQPTLIAYDITSQITVNPDEHVAYFAQNEIQLKDGFHTKPNDDHIFCAQIIDHPCLEHVPLTSSKVADAYRAIVTDEIEEGILDNMQALASLRTQEEIDQAIISSFTNDMLQVYPNPTEDQFNIDLSLSEDMNLTISIFDITGKKLEVIEDQKSFMKGRQQLSVSIGHLQTGIYLLVVQNGAERAIRRVVKR